jgi:4-aminobutyrate aminotransferase/(S)-3-amino-2-methylpropionate transaminase
LTTRLNELKDKHPVIAEVRGRGAMIAIEFVEPGTLNPNSAASDKVVKFCHMNGVIVLNAGTFGNVIRFLPPLAITDAQLHEALDVLAEGLATL